MCCLQPRSQGCVGVHLDLLICIIYRLCSVFTVALSQFLCVAARVWPIHVLFHFRHLCFSDSKSSILYKCIQCFRVLTTDLYSHSVRLSPFRIFYFLNLVWHWLFRLATGHVISPVSVVLLTYFFSLSLSLSVSLDRWETLSFLLLVFHIC